MIVPISIYYELCDPKWTVPQGATPNHILFQVTSGWVVYRIEDYHLTVEKGDLVYVPQDTVRSAQHDVSQPHYMYVAHFQYEQGEEDLSLLTDGKFLHIRPHNPDYFIQRFSLLTQYWLKKPSYYETICHGVLLEMLALINGESDSREFPVASYNLVMEIQEYIVNHYRDKIHISDLAKHVERTPNYVSTVFRGVTGQTISEYMQQVRIGAARDLLFNSQMTIGEISDYLGFCEQSYFNKVFKKITGVPPSAFLKEKIKVWRDGSSTLTRQQK